MQSVVCANCGAPLDVSPDEIRVGFAKCPYCNGTTQIAERVIVEAPAKSKEPKDRRIFIGSDKMRVLPEQLNEPASRPADTKLELINEPGVRFRLLGPKSTLLGFIVGGSLLISFGGAFVGIIVPLALEGLTTGFGRLALVISIAAAAVLMGGSVWFGIRIARKREEIRAHNGKFLVVARGIGASRKEYDWNRITSFQFERCGTAMDDADFCGMFMNVGRQKTMLWCFFATATGAEQRWILTELRAFFEPIWQHAAAQSADDRG